MEEKSINFETCKNCNFKNKLTKNTILLGESGTGKTKFIVNHLKQWSKEFSQVYIIVNKSCETWYQKWKKQHDNVKLLPLIDESELTKVEKQLSTSKDNLIIIDELDSEENYFNNLNEITYFKEWNALLEKLYANNTILAVVHPAFFKKELKRFNDFEVINFD